eukprot:4597824-Pyramimonas_sp.AAC.2
MKAMSMLQLVNYLGRCGGADKVPFLAKEYDNNAGGAKFPETSGGNLKHKRLRFALYQQIFLSQVTALALALALDSLFSFKVFSQVRAFRIHL